MRHFSLIWVVLMVVVISACRKYEDDDRRYVMPKRMMLKGEWELKRTASYPLSSDSVQTIDTIDATFTSTIFINNIEYCERFDGSDDNSNCQSWGFIEGKRWIRLTNAAGFITYRKIHKLNRQEFNFTTHIALNSDPLLYMEYEKQ